jgi:hypothetical protein
LVLYALFIGLLYQVREVGAEIVGVVRFLLAQGMATVLDRHLLLHHLHLRLPESVVVELVVDEEPRSATRLPLMIAECI